MRKIKVLHIIGALKVGGAENVAMNFCRYLDKQKFQCDYLVFGDQIGEFEAEAIQLGSKIYRVELPSEGYLRYIKRLREIIRMENYDVVHTHTLLNNGISLYAAKLSKVEKRVSHSHSTNSGKSQERLYFLYERLMKFIIRIYSTHYIACGLEAGIYLYGKQLFKKKGIILNNAIDVKRYSYNETLNNQVRSTLGVNLDATIVGHVGRLCPVKNHKFLIDVFLEYNKKTPNSYLLIIGDGELKEELKKQVIKNNLEQNVIFTGARMDISDIIQSIDVVVFPSLYEGFPVSLIEFQAAGIPCIVSTNVTKHVQITGLIHFLGLNKPILEWSEKIDELSNIKKTDMGELLITQGYDINSNMLEMEKIYEYSN